MPQIIQGNIQAYELSPVTLFLLYQRYPSKLYHKKHHQNSHN